MVLRTSAMSFSETMFSVGANSSSGSIQGFTAAILSQVKASMSNTRSLITGMLRTGSNWTSGAFLVTSPIRVVQVNWAL